MITIIVDYRLERFEKEIRHAFDFVFNTLGYNHRYIKKLDNLKPTDILFIYGSQEPTRDELLGVAEHNITFFIPSEPDLLQLGQLNPDQIRRMLREIRLVGQTPVLSKTPFKRPAEVYKEQGLFAGKFNFDIVGNIFFHLAHMEELSDPQEDAYHRYPDMASAFQGFTDYPFLQRLLWLIDSFLKEEVNSKQQYMVKKELWPENQPYAAAMTHTVDRLQKWDIPSLFTSIFDDCLLLFTLRLEQLAHQVMSKVKYVFTNYEMFWNFQEILEIEREYNIKSTYFLSLTLGEGVDYDINDPDLQAEIESIKQDGHEIGLYLSSDKISRDVVKQQKNQYRQVMGLSDFSSRQKNYCLNPDLYEFQQAAGFTYDSSLSFQEKAGFRHGLCFPYLPYYKGFRGQYLELPVMFRDDIQRITKHKQLPFDTAKAIVRSLIENAKKANGMICMDFTVANHSDLVHNDKLYRYAIETIQEHGGWLTTQRDICQWWDKRKNITVEESEYEIGIYFPDDLDSIVFSLLGKTAIREVDCSQAEVQVTDNKIQFRNIKAGTNAFIMLSSEGIIKEDEA